MEQVNVGPRAGRGERYMRVHVQVRGIENTPDLVAFVQRRAQFALGRFSGFVHSVSVRLWENSGPPPQRGCDVRISCGFHIPVTVRVENDSISAAVVDALDRAERAVSRQWRTQRAPSHTASRSGLPFGD